MTEKPPRILGVGYDLPSKIRTNDDPIFDWLKENPSPDDDLFIGYEQRRVLAENEDLMSIMLPAAQKALDDAGLKPSDVDVLLGYASISDYLVPNDLGHLHQRLGLPERAWVLPLNNGFTNFNAGLLLADGLIRAGRANNALIAVAGNWTRFVDYHTPQAVSASDGAAAAVLGSSPDEARWELVDHETITQSKYFGSMYMQPDSVPVVGEPEAHQKLLWSKPYYHITGAGIEGFKEFGVKLAPTAATAIMKRNGLRGGDVTLIPYQASDKLLDAWLDVIKPAKSVATIKRFANMTLASVPVNLAWSQANDPIEGNFLILLGVGPDMHANALLLRREPA